jgi:hypothetical protein
MAFSAMRLSLLAGMTLTAAGMASAAQATCADLVAAFDEAVAAHAVDAAISGLGAIGGDAVCEGRVKEFRGKLMDFLIG